MNRPGIEEVTAALNQQFGDAIISTEQQYDFPVYTIKKESLVAIIRFLYDDDRLRFRYLTTACGLHYPQQEQAFGMMYQLHSLENNIRIRIKTFTSIKDLQF